MRRLVPVALIAFAALMTGHAHAAPGSSGDELDKLLADKGLLTQIDQVGKTVRNKASELVVDAMGFLGVPYKRGGNTAETGFDCSGFVRAIYEQSVGLLLPRRAEQQAAATQRIDKTELQPGDLVFFNTLQRAFSHVGIYVGEGKFIHSPKPGAQVRVESMGVNYWSSHLTARGVWLQAAVLVATQQRRKPCYSRRTGRRLPPCCSLLHQARRSPFFRDRITRATRPA